MNMKSTTVFAGTAVLAFSIYAQEPIVFNIPKIDKHTIDANVSAWGSTGFRVDLLPDPSGNLRPVSDFDPRFRLAWNDDGLLVLLTVRKPGIVEATQLEDIWSKDSFEIFMAQEPGAAEYFQAMISPGCDPDRPQPRTFFNPRQKTPIPLSDLTATVARTVIDGGYVAEVMLPWSNLKIKPKLGDTVAMNIYINAFDPRYRPALMNAIWYPVADTSRNSKSMYTLKLSDESSPPMGFTATATCERFSRIHVQASAGEFAIGKTLTLNSNGKTLGQAQMKALDGRACADIMLPVPEPGAAIASVDVALDGEKLKSISMPDVDGLRTREFAKEKIQFESFCFSSRSFPHCDFEHPDLVEKLYGGYSIKCSYFDGSGASVLTADKPGRYAAVVEINWAYGRTSRRFCTLYRCEENFRARFDVDAKWDLPSGMAIPDETAKEYASDINDYASSRVSTSLAKDSRAAETFAALHDLCENKDLAKDERWKFDYINRSWWVNFKRKFYGYDKTHPKPFVCPVEKEGEPATVVHEGPLADAGMKPGSVEKLDTVCQQWLRGANEPFAVCIVRRGVVVLHKAYGNHRGEPVTLKDKLPTASCTKFLAATLMMEMVDQGLVNVDATVDTYVPALRGIESKKKLSVRELYLHVTGLPEQIGDNVNDQEEIVADCYSSIPAQPKQNYQGTGLALGGKIVEMISGEIHPSFFRKHLLEPLGCTQTGFPGGTSGGADTTAFDLAKCGQMMINGGAYGKLRFLHPQTVALMAPQPGNDRIGPDKNIRWGIGTKLYDSDKLSASAYGHSGACGTFLLVDPEREVVATMVRFDEGKDYLQWRARMFETLWDGIEK
jgi:CubicO group peptidase (beta-lactamase class C family)